MHASMSIQEANRLLTLEAEPRLRAVAPEKVIRMSHSLCSLGKIAICYDPGGHGWAVVLVNSPPVIIYSQTIDGE